MEYYNNTNSNITVYNYSTLKNYKHGQWELQYFCNNETYIELKMIKKEVFGIQILCPVLGLNHLGNSFLGCFHIKYIFDE